MCLPQGVVRHIHWTLWEMETYITSMEKVMRGYVQRLQWLLSGKSDNSWERWEEPERKWLLSEG